MKQDRWAFYLAAIGGVALALVLATTNSGIRNGAGSRTAAGSITSPFVLVTEIADKLATSEIAISVRESDFGFPGLESVHLIGVALFFGSIVMLDLRLLGIGRAIPMGPTAKLLLPIIWTGFVLQVLSGGFLFVAYADQYVRTVSFPLKMALVVAGGANMMLFHRGSWRGVRSGEDDEGGPDGAWVPALISMTIWLAAIVAGRWAGYERQPIAVSPAPTLAPIVAGTKVEPAGQAALPPGQVLRPGAINLYELGISDPLDFLVMAKRACNGRDACLVDVWEMDGSKTIRRFAYSLSAGNKMEQSLWDCDRYPKAPAGSCLPK